MKKIKLLFVFLFVGFTQLKAQTTCKEVVGYYPNWQWYDRAKLVQPNTIQYAKYTLLNYSFFNLTAAGHVVSTDTWADENLLLGQPNWSTTPVSYYPNTSIVDLCHNANKKIVLCIGGWTMSGNFPAVAADPAKRAIMAHDCKMLCDSFNMDGIDIDWEYPGYAPNGGTAADMGNYPTLLQQIRDSLDVREQQTGKPMLLTACFGASISNMSNINWNAVVPILDMINLMSYDFFGTWDATTNHNSPLTAPAQGDTTFNLVSAVNRLLTVYYVPANKINAGVAFYGRSAKTTGAPGLHVAQTGQADNVTFFADDGTPLYYNILLQMGLFTSHWDTQAQVPYLLGNANLNTFVSYDDKQSIALKAQYIKNNNLRGAIIWEITGDYVETAPGSGIIAGTPLLDTLNTVFCNSTQSTCLPPTNLLLNAISASSANVSWTASAGASSYLLSYRVMGASTWTTQPVNASPFALAGLLGGTVYEVQLAAVCSGVTGTAGPIQSFTTLAAPCSSSPNLSMSVIGSTNATCYWTPAPGALSYHLQWKAQAASIWNTVSGIMGNTYNLSGLTPSTAYHYRLQPVCIAGTGSYSLPKAFNTTSGGNGCNTPSGLNATALTTTSANLTWNAYLGAVTFDLRYRINGGNTWTNLVNLTSNSYALSGLTSATTYEFQVRSNCAAGSGSFSASKLFTTNTSACGMPGGLTMSVIGSTNGTCLWTAVPGAIAYTLEWKAQSASSWNTITSIPTNSYSLSGLLPSTAYHYRVLTICGNGSSSFSTPKAFTTTATGNGCNIPSGLNTTSVTVSSATLFWTAYLGAQGYDLRYRVSGSNSWTNVLGLILNSYACSGLLAGTTYEFQVRANCAAGSGNFSASKLFTTLSNSCGVPTTLTMSVIGSGNATCMWSAVPGAMSYNLQWKAQSATSWNTVNGITTLTYNLNGLSPSTGYHYRIQSVCNNGSGIYSTPKPFTTAASGNGCTIPTGLGVLAGSLSATGATIKWNSYLGAISYNLQYKGSTSATWMLVSGINSTTYALSGLNAATTYDVQIQAQCAAGTGAFSNTIQFTTLVLPCPTPLNLSASLLTSNSITMQWTASQNAQSYEIQYRIQGSSSWSTQMSAGTSIMMSGLNAATTYEFQVRSLCGQQTWSPWSPIVAYTTNAAAPVSGNDEACTAYSLTVNTGCQQTNAGNSGATPSTTPVFSTLCTSSTGGKDVWFTFLAPASGNFTVKTFAGTLTDAVATLYYANSCLQLSPHQCVDDYNGNTMPNIIAQGYTPGSEIFVRVWGKNNTDGSFAICVVDGVSLKPSETVTQQEESAYALYPNPVHDELNIQWHLQHEEIVQVQILDMQGRIIHQITRQIPAGIFLQTFNMQSMAEGMYQIRSIRSGATNTGTFILRR